jgi:SET domain-containing protein
MASLFRPRALRGVGQKLESEMLRVSTYIAPSRISGVGVFSAQRLQEGTRIWEFTEGVDWLLTPAELDAFPEPYRSRLGHYVYLDDAGTYVLCGDNAKFMNHAEAPNCSDSDPRFTITLRTIEIGEELTCDYREFDRAARSGGALFG